MTDEDIYGAIAPALRLDNIDAVSTPECDRLGESDTSQLLYATQQGRALVTFNVRDFAQLHAAWLADGKHHAGIIVSQQRPIGELLRRLKRFCQTNDQHAMRDGIEYL